MRYRPILLSLIHISVICPSIIVAVRRGTEILLANHKRHYTPGKAGIYTTLAGFVEVGETFEAVSYTHLDVYKRQRFARLNKCGHFFA